MRNRTRVVTVCGALWLATPLSAPLAGAPSAGAAPSLFDPEAGAGDHRTCVPLTNTIEWIVTHAGLGVAVAVIVEERPACEPARDAGFPMSNLPTDRRGVALLQWVIDDVAQRTSRPAHVLVRRGDAWLVSPPDGERLVDLRVSVDPASAPSLEAALATVSRQLSPRAPARYLDGVAGNGRLQGFANEVRVDDQPLLEAFRALLRPHESPDVPVGLALGPHVAWALEDVTTLSAQVGETSYAVAVPPSGAHLWRAPDGTLELRPDFFPERPGWVRADELVRVGADGARFYLEDPGRPPVLRPPTPDEQPPDDPRDPARKR